MKYLAFFLMSMGTLLMGWAQPQSANSNSVLINFGYPELVTDDYPSFNDRNNNSTIDVGEQVQVAFSITNEGKYVANNVQVITAIDEQIKGLKLPEPRNYGNIAPGVSKRVKLVLAGDQTLAAGVAQLRFVIIENADTATVMPFSVLTADESQQAKLSVNSHIFFAKENRLQLDQPFDLKFDLQNLGNAPALEVSFRFKLPEHVLVTSSLADATLKTLGPGQIKDIRFTLIAGVNYSESNIPITVFITDRTGQINLRKTFIAKVSR